MASNSLTKIKSVRTLQRWWQVQSIFLRYGFDMLVDQSEVQKVRRYLQEKLHQQPDEFEQYSTPEKVRLMLQELGPTFVKLGQMAASQSNTLPPDWIEELEKLQSDVPPFPEQQVRHIIATELGAPLEEKYKEFNLEPLAAASIGQVHTAVTHNNQPVVVKVQRPNIVPQIEADVAIMKEVASWLEKTATWARNYGVSDIIDEFAFNLQIELDYRNEGRNADRLRGNLAAVGGVHIPYIYWDLVTERVLTMERVNGVKITNLQALDEAGLEREALVETFMRSMIQQLLIDGFFHADPHPGNIFVELSDGTIVFLDTGMMGHLAEDQRREVINLLQAVQRSDTQEIVRIAMTIGIITKPVNERILRRDISRLLNRYMTASLSEIPFAEVMSKVLTTIFDHGIRMPSELTLALKALVQTEEIARTLKPEIQITDVAQTISRHLLFDQFKPETIANKLNSTLMQLLQLAPLFHAALEQLLREVKSGKLTIRLDIADLPQNYQELPSILSRLTIGIAIAGMTVGSAIVMTSSPETTWWFVPFLGVVGFILSMAAGCFLVFSVLWRMWRANR